MFCDMVVGAFIMFGITCLGCIAGRLIILCFFTPKGGA